MTRATAIGVGRELIPTESIQRREGNRNAFTNWPARRFARLDKDAREQLETWKTQSGCEGVHRRREV